MAKWSNRKKSLAHSNRFSHYNRKKMKPAKNITYIVIKIWKFLSKKNKGIFDKLLLSNRYSQNFQNLISGQGVDFSSFAWFCLFGPRLSSLDTSPLTNNKCCLIVSNFNQLRALFDSVSNFNQLQSWFYFEPYFNQLQTLFDCILF